MTLLAAWVLFPLILAGLSLGLGLLADRCAGGGVPGVLVLPLGFAVLILVSTVVVTPSATAGAAVSVVVMLALLGAGLELAYPSRARRVDGLAAAAAVAVFLVYGAPVILSGAATFAGYAKLDDTASWLALADHVLVHGRSLAGVAPSSYQTTLHAYLANGYPLGSLVPLGIGARLAGTDAAWVFQAYLAFQAALLALVFESLLHGPVGSPRRRAVAVFVAAQPALLYGYSLWGSVKELVTVPLLALVVAFAPVLFRRGARLRELVPLAVAAAALVATLNVGGGVWILCAVVPCLVLALRLPRRDLLVRVGALAALAVAFAIPAVTTANGFLHTALHSLTGGGVPLNLIRPLDVLQVAGIWPSGDFRFRPPHIEVTYVLIAAVLVVAAWGLFEALRLRHVRLPLYVGASLAGCAILASFGSPWVDAKVLATASPAIPLAALAGASLAFDRGWRIAAAGAVVLVAGGVLWSNALAYHDAWLAPRDQLAELETIGKRFAGQGPTLLNEPQVYGATHFLRRLDPDAPGGPRYRVLQLRDGSVVPPSGYADIDGFLLPAVLVYRTLVVPRSPVASRPPSVYTLAWRGRYYDVWERQDSYPRILEHISLGRTRRVEAVAPCPAIVRLGKLAAASNGSLAYVARRPPIAVELAPLARPNDWGPVGTSPVPRSAGTLRVPVVTGAGTYAVWLAGSFAGRMGVLVDGRPVGAARHRLEHPGQFVPFGTVRLTPGRHEVALRYSGPDLHPGSAAGFGLLAGVVLATTTEDLPVQTLDPSRARELCGRSLDWIEAVAST